MTTERQYKLLIDRPPSITHYLQATKEPLSFKPTKWLLSLRALDIISEVHMVGLSMPYH